MNTRRPGPLLHRLCAVALGGLMGGLLRYIVTVTTRSPVVNVHGFGWVAQTPLQPIQSAWTLFDLRLLVINSLGALLATWLLLGPLAQRPADEPWRLFWTTGVLGGLTTSSSLMLDLGRMWQIEPSTAILGALVSLGLGATGAAVGWLLARHGSR